MAEVAPRPTISVVAPTYKRRAGLPRFVEAVLIDPGVHELVMAVDGSQDGSVEWLLDRASTDNRLVVIDLVNGGSAAARQTGVEAATGDVVLLLDDDVIAEQGLATRHAEHHRAGQRILVLGYMPNEWSTRPPETRAIGCVYRQNYEMQCERYTREPVVVLRALWAGNFSMRRADVLEIGMHSETVGKGAEDLEFGMRCYEAGIRGVFDRGLGAEHDVQRTLSQYRRDCFLSGRNGRGFIARYGNELDESLSLGQGLPRWARRALPLMAKRPIFPILVLTLQGLFSIGLKLHLLKLEMFAVRGLGSLENQRGQLSGDGSG